MATSWFVRGGGKVYGPLDSSKLKKLVADGKIDQTTEVSQDQNGPWVAAGKIKGLFVQPPIPATPAPAAIAATVPVAKVTPPAAPPPAPPAVASPPSPLPAPSRRRGYVEANLLPNEQLVYRGKLHWLYFLRPLLWFAAGFFLIRMGMNMNASERDTGTVAIVLGVLAMTCPP